MTPRAPAVQQHCLSWECHPQTRKEAVWPRATTAPVNRCMWFSCDATCASRPASTRALPPPRAVKHDCWSATSTTLASATSHVDCAFLLHRRLPFRLENELQHSVPHCLCAQAIFAAFLSFRRLATSSMPLVQPHRRSIRRTGTRPADRQVVRGARGRLAQPGRQRHAAPCRVRRVDWQSDEFQGPGRSTSRTTAADLGTSRDG